MDDSITLEQLEQMEEPQKALLPLNEALSGMRELIIEDEEQRKLLNNG